MPHCALLKFDTVRSHLEGALTSSPADYTELVWIETKIGQAVSSNRATTLDPRVETTVLVRVRERRRFGYHRTGSADPQDLQEAIRTACSQARVHDPIDRWRAPHQEALGELPREGFFDPRLSDLSPERGRDLLRKILVKGERGQLDWAQGRVAIANSKGLRRRAQVTSATVFVSTGRGAEAGTARSSARTLQRLDLEGTVQRARSRRCSTSDNSLNEVVGPAPTVLSSESVTAILEQLSHHILIPAREGREGFFQRRGGQRLLNACVDLYDDGGDGLGLAFPFDLKGCAKTSLWLIRDGILQPIPRGRSVPEDQLGAFSAGGGETRCSNLVLKAGTIPEKDLLAEAQGGVWVSSLSHVDWTESHEKSIRCRARGLRRIQDGALAEALPDQVLETSLSDLLDGILKVGDTTTSRALGTGIFGGTTAPALLLKSLPWRNEGQTQTER